MSDLDPQFLIRYLTDSQGIDTVELQSVAEVPVCRRKLRGYHKKIHIFPAFSFVYYTIYKTDLKALCFFLSEKK